MSFFDESSRPPRGHPSQEHETSSSNDTTNERVVHSPLTAVVPQSDDDDIVQGQSAEEDFTQYEENEDQLVPARQSAAKSVSIIDQRLDKHEAAGEPVADMPSSTTADGKPIAKNRPCVCGTKRKFMTCCGQTQNMVVQSSPVDETKGTQISEYDGSDEKDNLEARDNNAFATNDGQPPQTNCEICSERHSYDTTCANHGTLMCRDCWTTHVERELSLNPYNGCRCPFCRYRVNNAVVEELLPYQSHFQAGKSLDDLEEMYQAAQATRVPYSDANSSGLSPQTYPGRRFGGGQRSSRTRAFETATEKEERRVRLDRILAESAEREARGREEWEQWRRARDAEEVGKLINYNIVAKGYDKNYPEDDGM